MKTRTFAVIGVFAAALLAVAGLACGDKVMVGVPDWNQPDQSPAKPPNVGDYPLWCSPTAGADLMGYWEDHYGRVGLTDRQVPPSVGYANNPGTYKQGLWQDGTVELGWWMDTGTWQSGGKPFPPLVGMTGLNKIGPGLQQYASDAFNDPGSGIQKVAYSTAWSWENVGDANYNPLTMWTNYIAEINANRPVLVTFSTWVNDQPPAPWPIQSVVDGQNVYAYPWSATYTHDHTVCGVGYSDATPLVIDGNERFIVQDNWSSTMQYVMVPFDNRWVQNDYITAVTAIPEPATMTLLALGGVGFLLRRRLAR